MHFPPAAIAAFQKIDAERIRAHVRFLSHDLLEGRGTGQRGGDIAAEYIATQFALDGLKPAGDNGTYMQKVPMVGITSMPETTFSFVPEPRRRRGSSSRSLRYVATDETQQPESNVNAEIVFVGYGIDAPEYKWDDYKGVDVKGKVLLMLVNEPPSDDPKFFNGKALTYYGRWTYKYEEAARQGAVGVILIHKTDMASYGWEVVRNSNSGEKSYLEAGRHAQAEGGVLDSVWTWPRQLATHAGLDLDKMMAEARSRDFRPVTLPVKLQGAHGQQGAAVRFEQRGRHAAGLRRETESRSGHVHRALRSSRHSSRHAGRQHLQRRRRQRHRLRHSAGDGARLRHGDADGRGAPFCFASVTAEEQGLLGSEYLGKHPPVPAGKITLDLNYDDIPPLGSPEEVEVSGSERTTFYPMVQSAGRRNSA